MRSLRNSILALSLLFAFGANAQLSIPAHDITLMSNQPDLRVNHMMLIIVAEGYKSSEFNDFNNKAYDLMDALTTVEPFSDNANKGKIGFYQHFIPSTDSGISYDGVTTKNTVFNAHWNHNGTPRLVGFHTADRTSIDGYFEQYDHMHEKVYVYFIINDGAYGGSGELPFWPDDPNAIEDDVVVTTVTDMDGYDGDGTFGNPLTEDNAFDFVVRHEFGHSLGDLDDEYWFPGETYVDDPTRPNRINIKNDKTGALASDTYEWEGGRYQEFGKWRRHQNDLMRGSTTPSGTSPNKLMTWPIAWDGNTEDNIEDNLNDAILQVNLNYFYLAKTGYTTKTQAIANAAGLTIKKWSAHKHSIMLPFLENHLVYNHSNGLDVNLLDGQNKWYRAGGGLNYVIKINNDGKILEVEACEPPPPPGGPGM